MLDAGDLGWFKLTAIAQYRYLTWKQDPQSPFAPARAEERYRANLHKVAAQPDKDLFAESGTHNRVWHRYALLKIARQVAEEDGKPVDPRVREYTDYHDKLIGEVGDTDDASAGYHWVFFDAAAALYFHTGDWDAFLKHPGFRKTLARYVEMVSPSGACPPFASCSGWPEVGASMWAYEWLSRLTKDGRFRWTSHRIAEYYYNHLDHRANQYHVPYDTARDNFVMAYLLADDSVPPTPPPGGSRSDVASSAGAGAAGAAPRAAGHQPDGDGGRPLDSRQGGAEQRQRSAEPVGAGRVAARRGARRRGAGQPDRADAARRGPAGRSGLLREHAELPEPAVDRGPGRLGGRPAADGHGGSRCLWTTRRSPPCGSAPPRISTCRSPTRATWSSARTGSWS